MLGKLISFRKYHTPNGWRAAPVESTPEFRDALAASPAPRSIRFHRSPGESKRVSQSHKRREREAPLRKQGFVPSTEA